MLLEISIYAMSVVLVQEYFHLPLEEESNVARASWFTLLFSS